MISPKTLGAAGAGMVSILFWTIAIATFWKSTFTIQELTALTTVTTTAAAFLAAWLAPDKKYVEGRAFGSQEKEIARAVKKIEGYVSQSGADRI